jgi:putative intracellular protease/amidase
MKHIFLLLLLTGLLVTCRNKTHNVLLFIKDGSEEPAYMLSKEVGTMRKILEQSGYKVTTATLSGEIIKTDSLSLTPDIRLGEARIDDYDGLLIPCMASEIVSPEAVAFVKKVSAKGKPIAAQLGSVMILGEAGILKGKKFAYEYEHDANKVRSAAMLKDGTYAGTGVIRARQVSAR